MADRIKNVDDVEQLRELRYCVDVYFSSKFSGPYHKFEKWMADFGGHAVEVTGSFIARCIKSGFGENHIQRDGDKKVILINEKYWSIELTDQIMEQRVDGVWFTTSKRAIVA